MTYQEPILTVAILDFAKPIESRLCLESVKKHLKIPHHVIFCDNGSGEDYPMQFIREGLVDQLITNRDSRGLGLGTRDLFAQSFGEYTLYLQNDQLLARDFTYPEFNHIIQYFGKQIYAGNISGEVKSISLAGYPCGEGIYSERAHIIRTKDYKAMEPMLGHYGAGVFADGPWRESQIQNIYKNRYIHLAWNPVVLDNGVYAVRDMKEGGLWCHRTDTKQLWCIISPKVKNPAYPKLSEAEFQVASRGEWQDGRIPEIEQKDSFRCWDHTDLAKMEKEYIADLRRRFKNRNNE